MQELIAFIVLIGLSLLFDKLNKKKAKIPSPPNKPISDESVQPVFPIPFFEKETEKSVDPDIQFDLGVKEVDLILDDVSSVEENNEISLPSIKAPDKKVAFMYSNVQHRRSKTKGCLQLYGVNLKRAVVLKEILGKPRSLSPY